jgi:FkbM family methyltransferase
MSDIYYKELSKLSQAKRITSLLPRRAQYRIAKALYNYESADIHGIDIVTPLQNDGLVCFINTKDIIGWNIFFFKEYEASTNAILSKYIKEGDIVIEAGSNLGSETLLISKLIGKGHIYGFEPNPYTFERLKINVSINELRNVAVYDYAMGEKNGEISFNIYPKGFCNPGMSSKYMETAASKKITVVQKTLDTFIKENNISKVNFIKMDIQGAEMDMIMGSDDTISRFKPVIFTEAYKLYNDLDAIYNRIKNYGYNIYLIDEKNMTLMKPGELKEGNWLMVYETGKS